MHNAKKQKRSNPSAHDYTIDEKLLILQEEVKDIKDLIIQKQQIEEARHNMILQTLANQNVSISNILAEQNVNLKSVTSLWKTTQFVTTFPLNTDEDLNECENLINDENKQEMISTVQALLGGRGIVKGLTSLISQNLLLDYNYQGIHNKKPLKNFKKLMSVLELASLNPKEPANFQDNMRKAIKGAKNRHFKDASVKRSKSKSESILN